MASPPNPLSIPMARGERMLYSHLCLLRMHQRPVVTLKSLTSFAALP